MENYTNSWWITLIVGVLQELIYKLKPQMKVKRDHKNDFKKVAGSNFLNSSLK